MNDTVQATGATVKAAAGTGLVISVYDGDADQRKYSVPTQNVIVSAYNEERAYEAFEPTSTVDAKNWYTAVAANSFEFDPTVDEESGNAQYSLVSMFANKYSSSIYYYDELRIQTNDGEDISGKDLVLTSISVDDGSDTDHEANSADLNKSLRIALVVTCGTGDPTTYFFAPYYDDYPSVNGVQKVGTTGFEAVAMSTNPGSDSLFAGTDEITLSESTIYGTTKVEVYIYYDGEDEYCFTDNTLLGVDTLTVDFTFAAVAAE